MESTLSPPLSSSSSPSLLDSKIVISKGFSLSLYFVAIVVFSLVFIVGFFLAYKNFTNVLKRNNEDVLMKNVGQVIESALSTTSTVQDAIAMLENTFQKTTKLYPSETLLILFLVDSTGKILYDSSSVSPTVSSAFPSFPESALKRATSNKDGIVIITPEKMNNNLKSYVAWLPAPLQVYFLASRILF